MSSSPTECGFDTAMEHYCQPACQPAPPSESELLGKRPSLTFLQTSGLHGGDAPSLAGLSPGRRPYCESADRLGGNTAVEYNSTRTGIGFSPPISLGESAVDQETPMSPDRYVAMDDSDGDASGGGLDSSNGDSWWLDAAALRNNMGSVGSCWPWACGEQGLGEYQGLPGDDMDLNTRLNATQGERPQWRCSWGTCCGDSPVMSSWCQFNVMQLLPGTLHHSVPPSQLSLLPHILTTIACY